MKTIITSIILIFNIWLVNCQSNCDSLYFDSLLARVRDSKNIKESFLCVNRYKNGVIKSKLIKVKYKDDPEDRYWQIGKSIHYYKTGQIRGWDNVDFYSKVLVDTAYGYDKKGMIHRKFICKNDSVFTQVPLNFVNLKVWISYPIRYRLITYQKGKIFYDREFVYNGNSYLLDGEAVFYNKDGEISSVFTYLKGKRIRKK